MLDEEAFRNLLKRALQGEQEACSDIVCQLEPVIRRAVRVHLPSGDPLRRLFDSMDICQSVLIRFLSKANLGVIQIQSPKMLHRLLRRMAVQRFIDKKREAQAQRRDHRCNRSVDAIATVQSHSSLVEIVTTRDLYRQVCHRFTQRELLIAELWAAGHTFPEIAQQLSQSLGKLTQPNMIRMALQRAFLRVSKQFPQTSTLD